MHTESIDKAIPKRKASFISMSLELSKSNGIGSINTIIPIITKIKLLMNLVKNSDNIEEITFPINIEQVEKNIDIIIKINFAKKLKPAFFMPYVIPIPSESILTDRASIREPKHIFLHFNSNYIFT